MTTEHDVHRRLVQRIDDLEARSYRLYQAIADLRLELQQQWRVLPSGDVWTPEQQQASEFTRIYRTEPDDSDLRHSSNFPRKGHP